jgi:drug/metabolite transporter (DMT)-like permease
MIAILGGLGAAGAWALSTLCSSRSSRLIAPLSVVAWVMLVGLLISAPIAAVHGLPSRLDGAPGAWLALSGAGNVVGLVFAYRAMRVGQVSLVAPLVSTEGAIAAVIALLAGESITPGAGVALAAIAVGVSLSAAPPTERTDAGGAGRPRGALLAGFAAVSFGVSLYATAKAAAALPTAWVVLSARLIGTVALGLPLALSKQLALTRRAAPLVVTSALCEVLGFFSYATGARHGIAVAAVLSSQFGAIAAVAGYVVFKERLRRIQLGGVVIVLVGVAVLTALEA